MSNDNLEQSYADLLETIKQDGLQLKQIPKREQTLDICQIAVAQNPLALKHVSVKFRSEEMCSSAVERNPQAFRYVPESLRNKHIIEMALRYDYKLLNVISPNERTSEACILALKMDARAVSYVPDNLRPTLLQGVEDEIFLSSIINADYRWMRFLPQCSASKHICLGKVEQQRRYSYWLPDFYKKDIDFLNIQKKENMLLTKRKEYSKDDNLFYVHIEVCTDEYSPYAVTVPFQRFDDFYVFLDGNLENAELRDFDFVGIDLNKYNIDGAVIHHDVLAQYGKYDSTYISTLYSQHIECAVPEIKLLTNRESSENENGLQTIELDNNHDRIVFYYISDIHLCHRVLNHFGEMATKEEVLSYIRNLARTLSTYIVPSVRNYLLIAGDTSSNFELSEVFFTELHKSVHNTVIVVISGNHELWDPNIEMHKNIRKYHRMLTKLGIIYLYNSLLIANEWYEHKVISSKELISMEGNLIREELNRSRVSILGGIGFSQFNSNYNATNMLYGYSFDTKSREEARNLENQQSYCFRTLYKKIKHYAPLSKLIVLTHMKHSDWDDGIPQPGWYYVSGHDHNSYRITDKNYSLFADNQIGYQDRPLCLKAFSMDDSFDIFLYYSDGIHVIKEKQYIDYNNGMNVSMSLSKKRDGMYILLKKERIYMFLFYGFHSARSATESLYILNGGKLLRAEHQDITYYYDNMLKYSKNVSRMLERLNGAQLKLSKFIKQLGGSGLIHGCIIDIDEPLDGFSYYHLFVNPIDGKITPYYATDIISRTVYKDLPTLLSSSKDNKSILKIHASYDLSLATNALTLRYSENEALSFDEEGDAFDYGTYIYKPSRIIRGLQYTIDKGIIRRWNDAFLDDAFIEKLEKTQDMKQLPEAFFLIGE